MASDPLDRETSLSVRLTEAGLEAKTNMRAIAALDYLTGGLFRSWSLKRERNVTLETTKLAIEKAALEVAGRKLVAQVESDPNAAKAVLMAAARREREQINILSCLDASIEALEAPRDGDPNPAKASDDDEEIDPDLLNQWEGFASKATSERMRTLLGKILAGEIRRPGSFSFATLRTVSELDAVTAKMFQEAARLSHDNCLFPSLTSDAPDRIIAMEAAGLVSSQVLTHWLGFDDQRFFTARCGAFALVARANHKVRDNRVEFPIYALTPAGVQLAELLPRDDLEVAKLLASTIKSQCDSLAIHRVTESDGSQYRIQSQPLIVITQPPSPPNLRA